MKLPVTELLEDCNVEHIALGTPDAAMAERVKARVLNELARRRKPRILRLRRRLRMTLLVAAVLLLFGTVAYAAGLFRVEAQELRKDAENPQLWLLHDQSGDEISLFVGDRFERALAFSFSGDTPPHEVEFRPGWLPEEMASLQGDWVSRLTAERLCFEGDPNFAPAYDDMTQPMLIESYSMSRFNQGGALLLIDFTVGAVTEEHWDEQNVDVLYFSASQHFDANPAYNVPERTFVQNYVLLSNPEAGWVVRIGGELDLETLLEVARNLEIRETGEILRYEDFTDHFGLFNAGAG